VTQLIWAQNKRPVKKDIRPHVLKSPLGVATTSYLSIKLSLSQLI
jgi:hypothetical protein